MSSRPGRRITLAAPAALLGYGAYLIPLPGLSAAGSIALGIFVTAALLWITEAIPLFVTSFVIVIAEVLFLGLPGGPLGLEGSQYSMFLAPFFDPIIALFLGGFVLGVAMRRYQLDLRIARLILGRAGTRPRWILAGFMASTAFLSMWISNTATTALMVAVLMPVLGMVAAGDPFRRALLLGVPFAANIGGGATPVGTPPNAIAIGALAQAGIEVSFLRWMVLALPPVLLLLAIAWRLLLFLFPPRCGELDVELAEARPLERGGRIVAGAFAVTILLWLTGGLHGVPEGIVALLPVVVFFGLGVLEEEALGQIDWPVLFLIGGGISLGLGMQVSGLTAWLVSLLDLEGFGLLAVALVMGGVAALMSTFISNTATANLLIPIVVGLPGVSPALVAAVALAASFSMILPVSTPPNAIAYGTGEIRMADMVKAGAIITVLGLLTAVLFAATFWPLLGAG